MSSQETPIPSESNDKTDHNNNKNGGGGVVAALKRRNSFTKLMSLMLGAEGSAHNKASAEMTDRSAPEASDRKTRRRRRNNNNGGPRKTKSIDYSNHEPSVTTTYSLEELEELTNDLERMADALKRVKDPEAILRKHMKSNLNPAA